MDVPLDSLESQWAAWMIQAGFVRKWTSSFQMLSRGTKWIPPFRNTNFIRLGRAPLKASSYWHEPCPFTKLQVGSCFSGDYSALGSHHRGAIAGNGSSAFLYRLFRCRNRKQTVRLQHGSTKCLNHWDAELNFRVSTRIYWLCAQKRSMR